MFFALLALRPATAPLEPGPRLELWSRVLERFFFWVIAAIVLLLASGYGMIFGVYGGFRGIGLHIHLMQGVGIIMMLLFFHLYFAPWRRFQAAVGRQDYPAAAGLCGSIGRKCALIEVLPSVELQLAVSPPSGRGRKRSVLLPFSSKTKLSSTIWPWRRDQTAGNASSMLGPIA